MQFFAIVLAIATFSLYVVASPAPQEGVCYTDASNGQTVTVQKAAATVTKKNSGTLTITETVNVFGTPPAKRELDARAVSAAPMTLSLYNKRYLST